MDASPLLSLDGFTGSLERLLALARAGEVARFSPAALVDQLAAALLDGGAQSLAGERGAGSLASERGRLRHGLAAQAEWVVMAAWLLLLRSRLLLPVQAPARQAAAAQADRLHRRLLALGETQALAAWLDRRPRLGRDVFARGRAAGDQAGRDQAGGSAEVDVVAFLWASLAVFDDDPPAGAAAPAAAARWRVPYTMADARARIMALLASLPEGCMLGGLLPPAQAAAAHAPARLRARSGCAVTFAAALELAREGRVLLVQDRLFDAIHVAPAGSHPVGPPPAGRPG